MTTDVQQASADVRALIKGQRAFNAAPSGHPAEDAAFGQSAALLQEIARDHDRTLFAVSALVMLVVSNLSGAAVERFLRTLDEAGED